MALLASAGAVLAMVAALATIGVVGQRGERSRLTVVTVRDLDTRPKASPSPQEKLEIPVEQPAPVFIPKPDIMLPAPGPKHIALDAPPPVVQIAAPAIASPAPSAAAPPAAAAPAAARDGGDLSGTVLAADPPAYPTEARRRRVQGTVKLLVLVDPEGRVADIEIADSSGSSLLDRAALRAVKRWRWSPNKHGGIATAVRGYVTIPFVLVNEAKAAG